MTQSFLNETSRGQHTELLAAFGLLFSKARRFYQYKAETASSGNLRRHFADAGRVTPANFIFIACAKLRLCRFRGYDSLV